MTDEQYLSTFGIVVDREAIEARVQETMEYLRPYLNPNAEHIIEREIYQ